MKIIISKDIKSALDKAKGGPGRILYKRFVSLWVGETKEEIKENKINDLNRITPKRKKRQEIA